MTKQDVDKALAQKFQAIVPPPRGAARKRVLLSLSETEYLRVKSFGKKRGERIATAVRTLTLAALDALGE